MARALCGAELQYAPSLSLDLGRAAVWLCVSAASKALITHRIPQVVQDRLLVTSGECVRDGKSGPEQQVLVADVSTVCVVGIHGFLQ